ncbi:MAG TPA: hypothetical protein VMJ75_24370, partial [Candidatus Acidoferrales bacterium]|nr:hypothetical protein [Candidatus Acidoferrales bacterium]
QRFTGYLDSTLMALFIVGAILVISSAIRRWIAVWKGAPAPPEAFGPPESAQSGIRMGCC